MRKCISILLAVCLLLALCACGAGSAPAQPGSQSAAPGSAAENSGSSSGGESGEETGKPLEKASLTLSLDEWPIVDGATAFLPYYTGMAALVLGMPEEEAKQYVLCSTTDYAYPNLVNGDADIIFCLLPSDAQVEEAQNSGVTFETEPVLNEAFVFFVNQSNPVDDITVQQLHDIYAGKITNWKELGGNDEPIVAYQRSEGSGSQTGLYLHVIPEDEVMEPPTEQRIGDMGGIVDAVASYDNASGALGYSYNYFVVNQHYDEQIKLLKVNGVYPGNDTIASGEYPMISQACAVFRSDEPEDSAVRKIAAWCRSEEGQQLAKEKNYVPSQTN